MNSVERYYQKKKRRKKKAKVLFFTLLFVLMMITLTILSMTVFFNAETINVEGNTRYTDKEILEVGGLKIGQNLFRLDKFEVIEKMESLPYVKEVTISRSLPNTLNVEVTENQPVVWVECDGKAAILNEEYRVLEFAELAPIEGSEPQESEGEQESQAEEETQAGEEPQAEEEPSEGEQESAEETENSLKPEKEEPIITVADTMKPALEGNLAFLYGVEATGLKVGDHITFPKDQDYTNFLKTLYEGFCRSEELEWSEVRRVDFNARFDIKVRYGEKITIDFGTMDQAETKLKLALYLLKENGYSREAVVDVSDTERVYFRPVVN